MNLLFQNREKSFELINSIGVDENSTEAVSFTVYLGWIRIVSSDLDLISKVKVGHSSARCNISIIIIYPGVTYDVVILLDPEVAIITSWHCMRTEHVGSSYRGCEGT